MTIEKNNSRENWAPKEYEKELVSVIVPTFNRAQVMMKTLDSVLNQDYKRIELIVVDDGSTDETQQVLNEYRKEHQKDDFIIKVIYQENSGVQAARYKGFACSSGEYIQFIDSDDVLCRGKLTDQAEVLKNNQDIDFVYAHARAIKSDGSVVNISGKPMPENNEASYTVNFWATDSVLFRRNVCYQLGPCDADINGNEDVLYATRMKLMKFKGQFIPKIYTEQLVHSNNSLSKSNLFAHIVECEKAAFRLRELLEEYGVNNKNDWNSLASRFFLLAWQYSKLNKKKLSQNSLFECMKMAKPGVVLIAMTLYALQACFGTRIFVLLKKIGKGIQLRLLSQITPVSRFDL